MDKNTSLRESNHWMLDASSAISTMEHYTLTYRYTSICTCLHLNMYIYIYNIGIFTKTCQNKNTHMINFFRSESVHTWSFRDDHFWCLGGYPHIVDTPHRHTWLLCPLNCGNRLKWNGLHWELPQNTDHPNRSSTSWYQLVLALSYWMSHSVRGTTPKFMQLLPVPTMLPSKINGYTGVTMAIPWKCNRYPLCCWDARSGWLILVGT